MVFAIGPGGTGKTYLAVAMAVSALLTKQVNRIILARPAVEAGERLGFLPGTLQQKIDPYMRPLYDALVRLLDSGQARAFSREGHHRSRAAGLHARADAERFLRHSGRSAEHHQRADEDVSHAPGIQLQGGDHRRRHANRFARLGAARAWSRPSRWSAESRALPLCTSTSATSSATIWCSRSSRPTRNTPAPNEAERIRGVPRAQLAPFRPAKIEPANSLSG